MENPLEMPNQRTIIELVMSIRLDNGLFRLNYSDLKTLNEIRSDPIRIRDVPTRSESIRIQLESDSDKIRII